MSKKNKVSSVKKGVKKVVKTLKPAKKVIATKAKPKVIAKKIVKSIVKKVIKPIIKKKEVKKTIVKKVTKPTPKKTKPLVKTIIKSKKTVEKAKKAVVKKITPPVVAKKVEKAKPIAVKAVVKPTTKKEVVIEKKAETTSKKATKEVKTTNEVIALNNTIPIKKENEISLSKIASISSAITNPVKKTESYSVKPEKEPNGKFELEFVIKASADLLYEFLYTQSGLSEWFCDDVNIRNGIYTFIWDGQMQQARLLKTIDHQLVRFQWVDKTDGSFFEFRLQHDDLTNDVSLMITDFADNSSEKESSKLLWQSQIEKLMHIVGSI